MIMISTFVSNEAVIVMIDHQVVSKALIIFVSNSTIDTVLFFTKGSVLFDNAPICYVM